MEVEGAGVSLAYTEQGSGRPLVVVHDAAADAAAWGPRLARLGGRAIAYDRRGYGASGAPDGYAATTVEEQAEDLAALVPGVGAAPAVLLGDGFGALIALDVAKRHASLAAGLVLADTPLWAFVPAATAVIAEQRSRMEAALRDGGRSAAAAAYRDGAPDSPGFFADYAGLSSWPVTRRELRAITMPVVVLTRPGSPPHVLAASDALAALLPAAERVRDGDPVTAAATR